MGTISKRTQYGLKAMLSLGRRFGEGPVLISTLSKEESIPIKFLELILLDLKSHDLLISTAIHSHAGIPHSHHGGSTGATAIHAGRPCPGLHRRLVAT
jgi:hypothetical protein